MPKSNPRALTKGVGATHGVTCPNCSQAVPNVTSGAVFGSFVPIGPVPVGDNWLFYGGDGERFLHVNNAGEPCTGNWGKHYYIKFNQMKKGGWQQATAASFLWFAETSRDEEQERVKI